MAPIVIYIINGLVAIAALVLAGLGKATWTEALLLVTALLTPSAAHIAIEQAKATKLAASVARKTPLPLLLVVALTMCKPSSSPIPDADAIAPVVNDVCSLIEGIDDNGAVRTICATVEEVLQVVSFILTLRDARDAGSPAASTCERLPNTTFCATSAERAKAILFLVRERQARATIDGGAR